MGEPPARLASDEGYLHTLRQPQGSLFRSLDVRICESVPGYRTVALRRMVERHRNRYGTRKTIFEKR